MKPSSSPQDEKIIELLTRRGTLKADYPPELLAARRAAFTADIEKCQSVGVHQAELPSQDQMIELLEGLRPLVVEYPAELLAKRRAAFIAQVEERNRAAVAEEQPSEERVIELLTNLKPAVA